MAKWNTARVVEQTLTDGSKVYDLELRDGLDYFCTLHCTTEQAAFDLAARIETVVSDITN